MLKNYTPRERVVRVSYECGTGTMIAEDSRSLAIRTGISSPALRRPRLTICASAARIHSDSSIRESSEDGKAIIPKTRMVHANAVGRFTSMTSTWAHANANAEDGITSSGRN